MTTKIIKQLSNWAKNKHINGIKAKLHKVSGMQNFECLYKEEQSCDHGGADYVLILSEFEFIFRRWTWTV